MTEIERERIRICMGFFFEKGGWGMRGLGFVFYKELGLCFVIRLGFYLHVFLEIGF